MLVSFSAKNYKSFYDEVTLDMRIEVNDSNREEIENNPFVYKINDDYISKLCILYGHNGSGKSNLLNAIMYLFTINIYEDIEDYYKELFIPNMIYGKDEDTKFTLEFYNYDNEIYEYIITLDNKNKKIKYELLKINNGIIFERNNNLIINGIDTFKDKDGIPNNESVISYFNSVDSYKEYIKYYKLGFAYNFLYNLIRKEYIDRYSFLPMDNIYSNLTEYKIWELYKKLISLADVGIDDIKVVKNNIHNKYDNQLEKYLNELNEYKFISFHKNYEDDFIKIESEGTKTYANNLYDILDSIKDGKLNILDEFNGVQSELLELVINLFKKNMFEDLDNPTAQLILSTHDTNLMCLKNTLLNHYWFLNKEDNKSELYCASDFEDLKREDLEKEYKRNSLKAKYNSRLFEIPSKFFINDEE
ncbi:AAA family ATPase [Brachyspira hyodysenteriae]|uniref:AAA family ATPase n=1 Tax=Brachyspira hyodysenteriae TaxID=159 RepID=UPI00063D8A97|nr:ATP-binding protein [Brachyspira hyodysenteriae]